MKAVGVLVLAFSVMQALGQQVVENNTRSNFGITHLYPLGRGGQETKLFFENWQNKLYKEMWGQVVSSGESKQFIDRIKRSPIRWRNLVILSEEAVGNEFHVRLSVEVTDVVSAFSACVVTLKHSEFDRRSSKVDIVYSPEFLGVQSFTKVIQTWRILKSKDKYLIDMCDGMVDTRSNNVMNYVLDSSEASIELVPKSASQAEKVAVCANLWLAVACINMNISEKEKTGVMFKAKPLIRKGEKKVGDLLKDIKRF